MKRVEISQDLANNILALIDVFSQRGAITGDELLPVGLIRNELKQAIVASEQPITIKDEKSGKTIKKSGTKERGL